MFTFRPSDYACNKEYRFYAVAANDYTSSAALAYGPPNSVIMPQCLRCRAASAASALPTSGHFSMFPLFNPVRHKLERRARVAEQLGAMHPRPSLQPPAAQPTLAAQASQPPAAVSLPAAALTAAALALAP